MLKKPDHRVHAVSTAPTRFGQGATPRPESVDVASVNFDCAFAQVEQYAGNGWFILWQLSDGYRWHSGGKSLLMIMICSIGARQTVRMKRLNWRIRRIGGRTILLLRGLSGYGFEPMMSRQNGYLHAKHFLSILQAFEYVVESQYGWRGRRHNWVLKHPTMTAGIWYTSYWRTMSLLFISVGRRFICKREIWDQYVVP